MGLKDFIQPKRQWLLQQLWWLASRVWKWFNTSQGAANVLTIFVVAIAVTSYTTANRRDRMARDAEMRVEIIHDVQMGEMMRRIGHRNRELEEILYKLIDDRDRYDPDLLTIDEQKLRQQLDSYLNYLEAVASLWHRDWLDEEDFRGFWGYYIKELTHWDPLWDYVTTKEYEWEDIMWAVRELTPK